MLEKAPRPLLVLLGLYFLLEIASVAVSGHWYHLAKLAIVGIAAWRTLQGSRAASFYLGALFALGTVIALWQLASVMRLGVGPALAQLVVAMFLGSISAYVFLSPKMRAICAEADKTRWRR